MEQSIKMDMEINDIPSRYVPENIPPLEPEPKDEEGQEESFSPRTVAPIVDEKIPEMTQINDTYIKELDHKANLIAEKIFDKCKEQKVDWFIGIVGPEGIGKSTLALNLYAKFSALAGFDVNALLQKTVVYDEDELLEFLANIDPEDRFLPLLLDEGANILFNRESMQAKRSYILKFFNVMRFLNSFVILCSPNIKFIDKNVKSHRLKSIFYVPQRGIYYYYDKPQIERMINSESQKKWYWIEPRYIGSYKVNQDLENIITVIKKNYVSRLSSKVESYIKNKNRRGEKQL